MFLYTIEYEYTERENNEPLGKNTSLIIANSDTSAINALYMKCTNCNDKIVNVNIINKRDVKDAYIIC